MFPGYAGPCRAIILPGPRAQNSRSSQGTGTPSPHTLPLPSSRQPVPWPLLPPPPHAPRQQPATPAPTPQSRGEAAPERGDHGHRDPCCHPRPSLPPTDPPPSPAIPPGTPRPGGQSGPRSGGHEAGPSSVARLREADGEARLGHLTEREPDPPGCLPRSCSVAFQRRIRGSFVLLWGWFLFSLHARTHPRPTPPTERNSLSVQIFTPLHRRR